MPHRTEGMPASVLAVDYQRNAELLESDVGRKVLAVSSWLRC
ncbi:hypothetical protein EDD90_10119 [Streptomyces sp. Ag109_O5-1]|nr:hypothetical protein EDD90_10119 [Streptomyces sp. Ag109_O5-1]